MSDVEIIIVGAGPAGMAAAATAANAGAKVLLLDEQRQAGGQIYRNVGVKNTTPSYLGKDYTAGKTLVQALVHNNISIEFGATVWRIDGHTDKPSVVWSRDGISHIAAAPHILLAGGAQERPVPFPGWTLPGVMTAGSAQILMKTAGLLPRDAVLAGSGPLLYLIAAQMIAAGAPPKALVETQTKRTLLAASPHLPRALLAAPTLIKGFGLLLKISAAGVKRYTGASGFEATAEEDGSVAFRFESKGRQHRLLTPLLLTHQGVVPSTHLSRASGIPHEWNEQQDAFQPVADAWGQTERQGFHVAGDGAGIGGAESAQAAGRIAAFDMLHRLNRMSEKDRDQNAKKDRAAQRRALAIRPLLDALYAPPTEFLSPPDETVVCRCEEVTAAEVRQSVSAGANGLRQIKTANRVGMGACQGRMCDLTVRGILVSCGVSPALPRARTPIKPITLGELATLKLPEESQL